MRRIASCHRQRPACKLPAAIERGLGIVESVVRQCEVRQEDGILGLDQPDVLPRRVASRRAAPKRDRLPSCRRSRRVASRLDAAPRASPRSVKIESLPPWRVRRRRSRAPDGPHLRVAGLAREAVAAPRRRVRRSPMRRIPSAGACEPQKASSVEASWEPAATSSAAAQSRAARRSLPALPARRANRTARRRPR